MLRSVFFCLDITQNNIKAQRVRFTVSNVDGSDLKQLLPLKDGERKAAVGEQNFPRIASVNDSCPEGVRVYRYVGFESYIRHRN